MSNQTPRILVLAGTVMFAVGIGIWLTRAREPKVEALQQTTERPRTAKWEHDSNAPRFDRTPASSVASMKMIDSPKESYDGDNMAERLRDGDRLREKVLMSQDEKGELHELLSDPEVIKHASGILLGDSPMELTPGNQERRMDAVVLLADALRWTENPIRGEVLAACKNVILSDNYHQIEDEGARKSVAADRFELFLALDSIMPQEAVKLAMESEESPNARLIAYSARVAKSINSHSNELESSPAARRTNE